MNRDNRIWIILILVGVALLGVRWLIGNPGRPDLGHSFGKAYVEAVHYDKVDIGTPEKPDWVDADAPEAQGVTVPPDRRKSWTVYEQASLTDWAAAEAADPAQTKYMFSYQRTIGVWFAAFMTIFVMTFLVGDNPLYKVAEALFIGVSAAYWMVVGFHTTLVPNLFGKLAPGVIRALAMPGLSLDERPEMIYLIPLVLGIMLLWRLMPVGGWISRWPMAFIIGVFCGLRLITFLHSDFLSQIRNTIIPLWVVEDGSFTFWGSLKNVILIVGVLSCLVYFFFSIEHKGAVGKTARLGIWYLMITFGAAFGYTVMGRIALLAIRFEFLFDNWLWLIDPTGRRIVETAALIWPGGLLLLL